MEEAEAKYPNNVAIWVWLIALLAAGLLAGYLPFGHYVAVAAIFAIALVKAVLVTRHYMHLRSESLLIYAIGGVPLLLLLTMALLLVPDIVYNR